MDKNKKQDNTNELEVKLAEMENNWKRALADYKNLEKRTQEEKRNTTEFANIVLIEQLLPVLDNFEMIEIHSDDMGVKMSIKEFKNTLTAAGLDELKVNLGDEFDHKNMDAVDTVEGLKNKVIEIVRKGYSFKEKLIRPVSVKVGNGEKEETAAGKENKNE